MNISQSARKNLAAYLFILPGVTFFLIFVIYPILKAFQMSFYQWSVMPQVPNVFVGLDNYIKAFNDPMFQRALVNTTLYVVVTVPGQLILALAVALLVNHLARGRVFFRVLYYLPVITSWVVVSLLFQYLFQSPNGIINHLLVNVLHLIPKPIAWLQNTPSAFVPIWTLGIWKGIGWGMVIFLAALQSVPRELYEAAEMDGANTWDRLLHITLPLIRPTLVFILVVLMIGGFNVFTSVLLITDGGPLQRTEVVLTYLYHQAFDYLDFGYGAAISFLLAALIMAFSFLQIRFLRKPVEIL